MSTRPKVLTTTPLFVVSDLQRSIDFYCQKLGFEEPSVWGEPPCFAMTFRDGFELMLSLTEGAATPKPNGPHGVWDVYVRVTDLDAELAALNEAGVLIDRGPVKMMYDMREIDIVDPDGYRICLAQDVS
jgi:catechol 2,3-dioxygenase-like lactoylglutathione lyase family enzyme